MASPKPLAVLDSNVIIYAILDDDRADDNAKNQKVAVLEKLEALSKTHRFGIPSVVLAELPDNQLQGSQLKSFASQVVNNFRILALGKKGAEAAARLCAEKIKEKPPNRTKDGVKLDAIVVGTALEHDAEVIITENGDDFEKLSGDLNLKIIVPSRDREKIQQKLPLLEGRPEGA